MSRWSQSGQAARTGKAGRANDHVIAFDACHPLDPHYLQHRQASRVVHPGPQNRGIGSTPQERRSHPAGPSRNRRTYLEVATPRKNELTVPDVSPDRPRQWSMGRSPMA
jgi:hypothetical protein